MAIEVRLLGRNDADVLLNVATGVFDAPIDLRMSDAFLRDHRHHLAVAIDDGLVVGFVSAVHYVHPDKPQPELWINEIAVAPTHRRRGLGKRLMRAMLQAARKQGCAEAWVLTERSNVAAMRLYAASGGGEPSEHVMINIPLDDQTDLRKD